MDFKKYLILSIFLVVITGCSAIRVANEAVRLDTEIRNCEGQKTDCSQAAIQEYSNYALTFVEFTERGNLFDRSRTSAVMDYIRDQSEMPGGVSVIVFVHGWKHNATESDSNVKDFKKLLNRFATNDLAGQKKVIGLYIGWRGKSIKVPGIIEATFWDRKSVAEEVGSGGVTEILSQLKRILVTQVASNLSSNSENTKNEASYDLAPTNSYLIIGHSFGGAIVLSALHDVFVETLVEAYDGGSRNHVDECKLTSRFADGVVLLNPAIEANKIVQLKELSAGCQFPRQQPRLMHVISTDADWATHYAFPAGQWLDLVITWNQEKLERQIQGKKVILSETGLDMHTVGNLQQFRTGRLQKGNEDWQFIRCKDDLEKCGVTDAGEVENHIPNSKFDPLVFIKTDKNFMAGHNDVFNCKVQSYLATIVLENQSLKWRNRNFEQNRSQSRAGCQLQSFNFARCFSSQREAFACSE